MAKKWTGERLETFIHSRDTIEHLHRYAIVNDYIKGKAVLDIACGEGYGSNLMSENAKFVFGVDIDSHAVGEAQVKYKKANIEFKVGSADNIPLDDDSIDVIVSFETIEHHNKHHEMMSEIKRVLKPEGIVIISTPDKLYYSDLRNLKNEFHIKELYKQEFLTLVSSYFKNVQLLNQKYVDGNSIIQVDDEPLKDGKFYKGDFEKLNEVEVFPLYLISISSESDLKKQSFSIFDGAKVLEIERSKLVAAIYQSNSYKIGSFILSPYRFLKRFLK
ncbi:MAG: class I SAM-dependent methyltransferase [Algibacter sp.]